MFAEQESLGHFFGGYILDLEFRDGSWRPTGRELHGNAIDRKIVSASNAVGYYPILTYIDPDTGRSLSPLRNLGGREYFVKYAGLGKGGAIWVQIQRNSRLPSYLSRLFRWYTTSVIDVSELHQLRDSTNGVQRFRRSTGIPHLR